MKTTQKINKLLAVSQAISKDKFRPVLRCIHFNGETVEATNGFILIQVKSDEKVDNISVPVESILNSAKTASKYQETVEIESDGKSGSINNGTGIQSFNVNNDNFPDTSKILIEKIGNKVSLGVDQLAIVIKAAKKMNIAWLTFVVSDDPMKPVYFEGRLDKDFTGVIMPIRSED